MILRPASEIYHDAKTNRKLYVCHNYPACNTYVAAHPNTAAVKLPEKPWVRCLRRGLLAIVLCGILSSLFVCIAFFVDVGNVYSVLRPFLYRIIKWNQKPIFHSLLGALLCLLGFPPKRKAPVEKQTSQ